MPRSLCVALLGLLLLAAAPAAGPLVISSTFRLSTEGVEEFQGVRLLGTVRLDDPGGAGPALTGLSGLAWDEARQRLYALSDRGALFHLEPRFEKGRLVEVRLAGSYPLRGADGKPLLRRLSDAEGLALRKNGELLISFEGKPRLERYRPDGTLLGSLALPDPLDKPRSYRNSNSMLEALAVHPRLGPLVGVERPLKGETSAVVPVCTLKGRCWDYPLADAPGSALTDMEVLPDGELLTLERAFVSVFEPLVITLRRVRLPKEPSTPLTVETVARFDTTKGWMMDNFEGLTHHTGNRYFMVSDDNSNALQHTLLVYFELLH